MIICTIYSHITGFESILDILRSTYPKDSLVTKEVNGSQIVEVTIKGGLLSSSQKLWISYRQRPILSDRFATIDDGPLTKNLKGLYSYVSSLPARNEKVKQLFLRRIQTLNAEFSIDLEKVNGRHTKEIISKLATHFDAILFVQPNTPISQAAGQHFLNKDLALLLDTNGNSAVDDLTVTISTAYFDRQEDEIQQDQKERKTRSEVILQERAIKTNKTLPVIESDTSTIPRDVLEIAERVSVLAVVNHVALGNLEAAEAIDYLKSYGLWEQTTPNEKDLLTDPTVEKRNRQSWKVEGVYILLWALQQIDELSFPDNPVGPDEISADQYPVGEHRSPAEFIASAVGIRTTAELLDANDLYYRLDWACVDARINKRTIAGLDPGVVFERHYALNWLINYGDQDWDDVSCDT